MNLWEVQINCFAYLKHAWCFCTFQQWLLKNLRTCGGHPVGEEIDSAGFVCSGPTGDMHYLFLFCFFLYISDWSFYWFINMFYGRYDFIAVSEEFYLRQYVFSSHKMSTMWKRRHLVLTEHFNIWLMWMGQMFSFDLNVMCLCLCCTVSHPPCLTSSSAVDYSYSMCDMEMSMSSYKVVWSQTRDSEHAVKKGPFI